MCSVYSLHTQKNLLLLFLKKMKKMWQCGNYKMFNNKVFFFILIISDFLYLYINIFNFQFKFNFNLSKDKSESIKGK